MSQKFASLAPEHRDFIARQKIFFVASAAPGARVNLSPKGMNCFAVLGDNCVAYLDSTGSGSETSAHLIADPERRLTVMFCAFEGDPMILRLYGQGESLLRGSRGYDALKRHFVEMPGARQIVRLEIDLVATSCGMAAPYFDYRGERENLVRHWKRQGLAGLRKYWSKKNMASIDGLPTGLAPETMLPSEAAE